MDVCLVNMPYGQVIQPSVAMGLLQAILEKEDIKVTTLYANLHFLEKIGFRRYMWVMKARSSDGLRDWTFAQSAFSDFEADVDQYLHKVMDGNRAYDGQEYSRFKAILLQAREASKRFVDHMAGKILSMNPAIVGCTTSLTQHVSSLALLRRIREMDPGIVTLLGGANCEGLMGLTTHRFFPWIDFVVSGDADGLITPLVKSILRDKGRMQSSDLPKGVYGPVHRKQSYKDVSGDDYRAVYRELDKLPIPNYDDYFNTLSGMTQWVRKLIQPSIPVETSRGCWWKESADGGCTFCSHSGCGSGYQSKSAIRAKQEICELLERYGVLRMQPIDNVIDPAYFKTLLPELGKQARPLRLFYEVRPMASHKNVKTMHEAGLHWVWAGIESLHSDLLKIMNKGTEAWQNIQFLKWCIEYGIYVGWKILYDFPGEDDGCYAQMAALLPLLFHLQPPSGCTRLRFDRNSHYFYNQSLYGLRLEPPELYSYVYPLGPEQMTDLVYFFEDQKRLWEDRLYSPLKKRPGLAAVVRTVKAWRECFDSNSKPELTMSAENGTLRIRDSRPAASRREHLLTGLEAELLLACEDAPTEKWISERYAGWKKTGRTCHQTLADLIRHGLLVFLDGRYVALPVRQPVQNLPVPEDYPGGGVVLQDVNR